MTSGDVIVRLTRASGSKCAWKWSREISRGARGEKRGRREGGMEGGGKRGREVRNESDRSPRYDGSETYRSQNLTQQWQVLRIQLDKELAERSGNIGSAHTYGQNTNVVENKRIDAGKYEETQGLEILTARSLMPRSVSSACRAVQVSYPLHGADGHHARLLPAVVAT